MIRVKIAIVDNAITAIRGLNILEASIEDTARFLLMQRTVSTEPL